MIAASDVHGELHRLDDALGHRACRVGIRNVPQDHRKFVAAQASDCVAILDRRSQSLRDYGEQLITGVVPDRVVHSFEVIEIDV